MRADADLVVYVGARWPQLVREAVLLGCPHELAADTVTEALSRCRRDWARASREEGVDRLVQEELVAAVRRGPSTEPIRREEAADELLVLAPPTLADLTERERAQRRQARRKGLAVGVPLLLVLTGAVAYTARGSDPVAAEPDGLAPAAVTEEANPAPGVVWYADGRLHLEEAVLAVDGVRDLTRIGTGVVFGDDLGRVLHVAADGTRTLLGHKDPGDTLAATDENGLVAWYDPDEEHLHVVAAATAEDVLDTWVGDDPEVVALDGETLFVDGSWGVRAVHTSEGTEAPVSPGGLVEVRARIRVFQRDDETIQVIHSAFDRTFTTGGVGARLSPDGTLVATRAPSDDAVLLFDTATGAPRPTGVDGEEVLAVAPGDGGTVTYVVADGAGGAELRTCLTGEEATCTVAAEIPDAVPAPVLAR